MRFAWGFDEEADACREMKMELAQQIMVLRQQGVTQFFVACDYGVGLCRCPRQRYGLWHRNQPVCKRSV